MLHKETSYESVIRLPHVARVALFLILTFSFLAEVSSQKKESKTVLVLHSLSQGFPATVEWDRAIRSEFSAQQEFEIDLYTEYMDFSEFSDPKYIEKVKDLYQYKYSNAELDLIITISEPALDFAYDYRDELFSQVPIVYGDVHLNSIENKISEPLIYGVFHDKTAFRETLNLIRKLHPDRKNFTVVCGTGNYESSLLKAAKQTFQEFEDELSFEYFQGLSVPELEVLLRKSNSDHIVLYLPIFEDLEGNNYVAAEVLPILSKASAAPIYSFWKIAVDVGCVGGYVIDISEEARQVAKLGWKVLSERSPITEAHVPNQGLRYMFNAEELERWSISLHALPVGSEIRNKRSSFFEQYLLEILLISLLVIVQFIFIGYLVIQGRALRRSKQELIRAEQKYRTVANYTYDWEYWQNPDGSLQWVSPSCERVCGYRPEEIVQDPNIISRMILDADKPLWRDHKCKDQSASETHEMLFRITAANGGIKWIEHTCQSVVDEQGQYLGVRANNRDVTLREEYKSKFDMLQSELIHMERAATMNTLSYSIAHELNQPLASMRSFAQAAKRFVNKGDLDEVKKALDSIVSENKRAASIIEHLRQMVKKDVISFKKLNINAVVKNTLGLLSQEIKNSNVTLKKNLDPEIPFVYGNNIQMQQVFLNLMVNALHSIEIQNAGNGLIEINTSVDDAGNVQLEIKDNGVGIREEHLEQIFDPFQSSKPKGMGLGLAISKLIVESHKGKIRAENIDGQGAKFVISIPQGVLESMHAQ